MGLVVTPLPGRLPALLPAPLAPRSPGRSSLSPAWPALALAAALRAGARPARRGAALRRRHAASSGKNRGLDPQRLLGTLRQVGAGAPRLRLPTKAESVAANGQDATALVLQQRREAIERGGAGLRPGGQRLAFRLPLIVKYHKPAGVMTTMRNTRRRGIDDLRSVVSMAGDRFELDLYHHVGTLGLKMRGLLLWSRSGALSRQFMDASRGVVFEFEAEVYGVVKEDELRAQLRAGVPVGVLGFQELIFADLKEAEVLADSPLQDLRSRLVFATRNGRAKAPQLLKACGHKPVWVRRTRIGALSLGGLEEGGLVAATPEEEEWACRLGDLPEEEYPQNRLPRARSVMQQLGLPAPRL